MKFIAHVGISGGPKPGTSLVNLMFGELLHFYIMFSNNGRYKGIKD